MLRAPDDFMNEIFANNPFSPPKSGRCMVNELPSELLSHIFSLGWAPERDQQQEEDDFEDIDEGDSDDGTFSSDSSFSDGSRSPRHRRSDSDDKKAR